MRIGRQGGNGTSLAPRQRPIPPRRSLDDLGDDSLHRARQGPDTETLKKDPISSLHSPTQRSACSVHCSSRRHNLAFTKSGAFRRCETGLVYSFDAHRDSGWIAREDS